MNDVAVDGAAADGATVDGAAGRDKVETEGTVLKPAEGTPAAVMEFAGREMVAVVVPSAETKEARGWFDVAALGPEWLGVSRGMATATVLEPVEPEVEGLDRRGGPIRIFGGGTGENGEGGILSLRGREAGGGVKCREVAACLSDKDGGALSSSSSSDDERHICNARFFLERWVASSSPSTCSSSSSSSSPSSLSSSSSSPVSSVDSS